MRWRAPHRGTFLFFEEGAIPIYRNTGKMYKVRRLQFALRRVPQFHFQFHFQFQFQFQLQFQRLLPNARKMLQWISCLYDGPVRCLFYCFPSHIRSYSLILKHGPVKPLRRILVHLYACRHTNGTNWDHARIPWRWQWHMYSAKHVDAATEHIFLGVVMTTQMNTSVTRWECFCLAASCLLLILNIPLWLMLSALCNCHNLPRNETLQQSIASRWSVHYT